MRIAFVNTQYYRAGAVKSWSGLPYFMARSLASQNFEVLPLSVTANYNSISAIFRFFWEKHALGKRMLRDRRATYLRKLGNEVEAGRIAMEADAVFAPTSLPLAQLPGTAPAFFWTDATFEAMHEFYASFSGLSNRSVREARAAERTALRRASGAFYASTWAANWARRTYSESRDKVAVVPFGANLEESPSDSQVQTAVQSRGQGIFRLLFVGVDWVRKGGAFALKVAEEWRERGANVELRIIGCNPPLAEIADRPWVICHGFLSKDTAPQRAQIAELMLRSDWLILPSQAECFGLVFAEAAAHGLPSLATRIGGIPSAVHEGKSGFLLPLDAPVSQWTNLLERFAEDRPAYLQLCADARAVHLNILNWSSAGAVVAERIHESLVENVS